MSSPETSFLASFLLLLPELNQQLSQESGTLFYLLLREGSVRAASFSTVYTGPRTRVPSPEHGWAPRWWVLTCCIPSVPLQNLWSWALRRRVSCCSFFWSSRHCKTRPRRCATSACRALHMQPAAGGTAFPSLHGTAGLRQGGCRDKKGSQAGFGREAGNL